MRRPFKTPLSEAMAELDFSTETLIEMPAESFYTKIRGSFPKIIKLPLMLVPPEQATIPTAFPPAYRFFAADDATIVQLGPRMLALNKIVWAGFPAFRDTVRETFEAFASVARVMSVSRFALAFFNRIPIQDAAEISETFSLPMNTGKGVLLSDFLCQFSRETPAGILLTQFQVLPPDERTPEPFLSVSNAIRFEPGSREFVLDEYLAWMSDAHDIARDVFWHDLTDDARASWAEGNPRG